MDQAVSQRGDRRWHMSLSADAREVRILREAQVFRGVRRFFNEPEVLLEILVITLNPPTLMRDADQLLQR